MGGLLISALRITSAIIAVLTLLAYLAPFIDPTRFSGFTYFGTAFPWLLLAHCLLITVYTWHRSRLALYHIGLLIAGWSHVSGFVGLNPKRNNIPENALSIATHNIGAMWRGKQASDDLREKMAAEYAHFLQENGFPDILCIQETGPRFYGILAEKMEYPFIFNRQKGTAILSRFPILGGDEIPFGKTVNSGIWADIKVGAKTLRIYNVHLQSNSVTEDTEKVIAELEEQGETPWNDVFSVLGKVGRATGIRARQARKLRQHINECPHPLILCGDLNDTPSSYVYRLLSDGLTDSYREKGFGLGTTYGGVLPLLRIDYILTDPVINPYSCRLVRNSNFSDHYPVFAEVGW